MIFSSPPTLTELQSFYSLPSTIPLSRPDTWSNTATTLDGYTSFLDASKTVKDITLSSCHPACNKADFRILQYGWSTANAVLISGKSLWSEPNSTFEVIHNDFEAIGLVILVVGSSGFDLKWSVFKSPNLLVVGKGDFSGLPDGVNRFEFVEWSDLMRHLRIELGIKYLDVSCGGSVIAQLRHEKLIDEVRIAVSGQICGPADSTGAKRPPAFPGLHSYSSSSSTLVKWSDVALFEGRILFLRGMYEFRHSVLEIQE